MARAHHVWHARHGVRTGEGPYLAATYRDLDGIRLVGLVLGVQLWAGD